MKQLLQTIFIYFIPALSFAQTILFEKSLEPDFDVSIHAIVHDSSGTFYAAGGGAFGFLRIGWYIRVDTNGIAYHIPLIERDDNYLNDITLTSDNNLLICGYNAFCDIAPPNQGILYKMSPSGNMLWKHVINPDTALISLDNKLRQVFEMQNGKILLRADSTLYFADAGGDSLWTRSFAGSLSYIGEELNHRIIAVNQSTIFLLDTLGQITNQFLFPDSIFYLHGLADSTYVIACGTSLMKLDSAFNIISQFDILQINFTASHLTTESGKIWVTNLLGSDFAAFDLNLQLTDTFRTQPSQVSVSSITVMDTTIVVAGAELSRKNYEYLKSYSTNGNYIYRAVDLELTSISFDTTYGYHETGYPQGVNAIACVPILTLTNTGTDPIHSFNINWQDQVIPGPCGYILHIKRIVNINLQAGQSMSVTLDTVKEHGIVYSPPFTYTFCAWVSCPDSVVDKDHSNDFLCDSFVVNEIVGVEALNEINPVEIYPCPTSSLFTISRNEGSDAILQIFNLVGEKIYTSTLHQSRETINAKLNPGVYFVRINNGKTQFTQKLLVE